MHSVGVCVTLTTAAAASRIITLANDAVGPLLLFQDSFQVYATLLPPIKW